MFKTACSIKEHIASWKLTVPVCGWLLTTITYPMKVMLLLNATSDPELFE